MSNENMYDREWLEYNTVSETDAIEEFKENALRTLNAIAKEVTEYMSMKDSYEPPEDSDLPTLNEWGLSLDAITVNHCTPVLRYQMAWGGPGYELLLYPDGVIEFQYLDWFKGIRLDVTEEEWAQWLMYDCKELMPNWEEKALEEG